MSNGSGNLQNEILLLAVMATSMTTSIQEGREYRFNAGGSPAEILQNTRARARY